MFRLGGQDGPRRAGGGSQSSRGSDGLDDSFDRAGLSGSRALRPATGLWLLPLFRRSNLFESLESAVPIYSRRQETRRLPEPWSSRVDRVLDSLTACPS